MEILLGIAAAVGALSVIGGALAKWVIRPVWRTWTRVKTFLEDFYGEPDRPGVPGRPGVMVQLSQIHAELRPNGGGSLRDAVNRIEERLADHVDDPDAHRQ